MDVGGRCPARDTACCLARGLSALVSSNGKSFAQKHQNPASEAHRGCAALPTLDSRPPCERLIPELLSESAFAQAAFALWKSAPSTTGSQSHNSLSNNASLGLGRVRFNATSCWRRARFSKSSLRRQHKSRRLAPAKSTNMSIIFECYRALPVKGKSVSC